ncbi:MAG: 3'-5' exonuclease [Saprospiraceae bacterium]|jgi:predicted PolB exonuclease-like 3'-5' exonuclease
MSAFDAFDLYNILFLDIETVPSVADFEDLPEDMQELWGVKCRQLLKRPETEIEYDEMAELFAERAGIYAEFGRIICISVGFLTKGAEGEKPVMRVKSFANTIEASLLEDFSELLAKHFNNPDRFAMCGHNIKEFDVPYICRRMLVNQLPLPRMLDIAGRKPWETKHLLDTLEMWKFGDNKNFTSLRLLTALFDIPSPKDDIDGSDVARVFWEDGDLDRIATYCEKDVIATTQLFLRLKRLPLLEQEQVFVVRS